MNRHRHQSKQSLLVLSTGSLPAHVERQDAVSSIRRAVGGNNYEDLHFPARLHKLVSCGDLFPFVFWSNDGESFVVERDGLKAQTCSLWTTHPLWPETLVTDT